MITLGVFQSLAYAIDMIFFKGSRHRNFHQCQQCNSSLQNLWGWFRVYWDGQTTTDATSSQVS